MAEIFGNTTDTPIKPDFFRNKVDNTFNPKSYNAQSGVAIGGELAKYFPLNTELQLELDGGDAGGTLEIEYILDNAMSDTSPNAVENRVIKQYVDRKTENIENLENDVKALQGDINALDEKHTEDVNALNKDTSKLKNDVAILEPIQKHRMFGTSYREDGGEKYHRKWYYVDNTNGSDDNTGNAFGVAFKTLKKALDTANAEGNHDTRIALIESETAYEFPYATCAIDCLHISGYSKIGTNKYEQYSTPCDGSKKPPVTIRFTNTERPNAFYCGHINFKGIKFEKSDVIEEGFATNFYSDGGCILFDYCQLDAPYKQNGGTLWMRGCYISQLTCAHATVRFFDKKNTFSNNNIQEDADYKAYRLNIIGCMCSVEKASDTAEQGVNDGFDFQGGQNSLIKVVDSIFSYAAGARLYIINNDNRQYDLVSDNSFVWFSTAHWAENEKLKNEGKQKDYEYFSNKKLLTDTVWIGGNTRIAGGTIAPMTSNGSVS